VYATPIITPNHLHHIKTGRVSGLYRVGLHLEQPGQEQIATGHARVRQ
jgi:hypothetical protein